MRGLLLPLVTALILSACGTLKSPYAPERMSAATPPAGSALIVFSTGAPRKCVSESTFLKLLPEGASERDKEIARVSVDAWVVKSDFTDHQGTLQVIAVPAGNYYFTPSVDSTVIRTVLQPKATFSVAAGETVYLGEYDMLEACTLSALYEVHDQMTRDMALLKRKDPRFDTSKVTKRLMVLSGGLPPCDATNNALSCR
jgi:hypothetical protein